MLPCKRKRESRLEQLIMRFCQTVAGNGLGTLQREATVSFVSSINVFQRIAGIGNKLKERSEKVFSFIIAADASCVSTRIIWFWFTHCYIASWIQCMEPVFSVARHIALKGILIPWRIPTWSIVEGSA